ncbi:inositol-tetrakisphosphate 1-kinase 3-like isoform X3 [Zingiber officinale]|uniref:inositol-tetrakisphosphate 1-kinase 3-like isoform X3 n=1 Tax=Zingiber officinale TaxID=94328 RepID=UPI001C4ACD1C|nr:inositol-tetrakisphosphate 1-kinase 3-like isoform X3 [Zingiber officinale]
MRLNGEVSCIRHEEEEQEEEAEERVPLTLLAPPPSQKLVVGYALTSKKVKSFLQPKLEGLARKKGIIFVAIDHCQPLGNQGPFDIVLHKLTGKEWQQLLELFRRVHRFCTMLELNLFIEIEVLLNGKPKRFAHLLNYLQNLFSLHLINCSKKMITLIPSAPHSPFPSYVKGGLLGKTSRSYCT